MLALNAAVAALVIITEVKQGPVAQPEDISCQLGLSASMTPFLIAFVHLHLSLEVLQELLPTPIEEQFIVAMAMFG